MLKEVNERGNNRGIFTTLSANGLHLDKVHITSGLYDQVMDADTWVPAAPLEVGVNSPPLDGLPHCAPSLSSFALAQAPMHIQKELLDALNNMHQKDKFTAIPCASDSSAAVFPSTKPHYMPSSQSLATSSHKENPKVSLCSI
ncbi:hypothetical protein TanjilG_23919 [Lupinus angustifolius]|uniref:Uncharacterized protein n=1 Tax=Lupinus angustifolius TaxID=3871 RepID=A0A1J7H0Z0_LUPAN|nr:hypothetical protein TanjilG_23919 [Lupinus angustifolius]